MVWMVADMLQFKETTHNFFKNMFQQKKMTEDSVEVCF